jgi:hypothetical protein
MGFFDRHPDPDDGRNGGFGYEEPPDPAVYVGGVIPLEVLLARSGKAAVAVRGLIAYPDGFEFSLCTWLHPTVAARRRRSRHLPMVLGPWEVEPGEELPPEFLRFGVQFPDGATATNLDDGQWRLSPDATEPLHGLESHSGGGTDLEYSQTYWAWPLPGPGDFSFVVEWPAYDIAEAQYRLDTELVRVAAERARPVWPELTGPTHLTRSMMTPRRAVGSRRPEDPPPGPDT